MIDENSQQVGVVSLVKAMTLALEAGLDLVEVSPNANPPVCKILDYGKYKYQQKKKEHAAKRHQKVIEVKEVKLRPKTGEHDLAFKMNHIRRFLEDGNKAKVTLMFRGREVVYADQGVEMLRRIAEGLKNEAKIEQEPKRLGRIMTMVLVPNQKG